jgi:hypothetical protein
MITLGKQYLKPLLKLGAMSIGKVPVNLLFRRISFPVEIEKSTHYKHRVDYLQYTLKKEAH